MISSFEDTAKSVQMAVHTFDQSQNNVIEAVRTGFGSCAIIAACAYALDPRLTIVRHKLSRVGFDHFSTAGVEDDHSISMVERKGGAVISYGLPRYSARWARKVPTGSRDAFINRGSSMIRTLAKGDSKLLKDNIDVRGRRAIMTVEAPEPIEVLGMLTDSSTITFEDLAELIRNQSVGRNPQDMV